jgi:hypothetical protein
MDRAIVILQGDKGTMNATMNRACPENEMFVKAMLGELPGNSRRDFLRHVSVCPVCRLKFEALAEIEVHLEARGGHIPMAVLSEGEARQLKRWAGRQAQALSEKGDSYPAVRPRLVTVAAAAALMLIVALSFFLFRHPASVPILRSGGGSELRLLEPVAELRSAPEVFRWTEVEGAKGYKFTLIDDELNVLYQMNAREVLVRLPFSVRQRLTGEMTYLWTVQAMAENNQELASASRYFEIE